MHSGPELSKKKTTYSLNVDTYMFIGLFGAKEFISGLNFKFGVVMTAQIVNLGVMVCPDGF